MSRGVIGPGDGPCPDCISRDRLVCPDRPYDGIVELLQTPATNLGVVPEARTCPKCCRQSAQVMPEGVWGGTTPNERRAARRRPSRHQASTWYRDTVSTAITGGNATCAGHAAGQPVP